MYSAVGGGEGGLLQMHNAMGGTHARYGPRELIDHPGKDHEHVNPVSVPCELLGPQPLRT